MSSAIAGSGAMCRRRNPSTHTTSTADTAAVNPTSTVSAECNAAAAAGPETSSVAAAGPASKNPPSAPPSATAAPLPEFHSVLAAEVGE